MTTLSRRILSGILVLAAFLSGGAGHAAARTAEDDLFERHELVTGTAKHQTVLTGSLLGDGAVADLAVVNVDESGDRRLRIDAFGDGTWAPRLHTTLGREVVFVDVARIAGRDRLITYERRCLGMATTCAGRLSWFDPESVTARPLVAVDSNVNPPAGGGIPHVDLSRDLNGDGLDDLAVPDADGFRVFVQTGDGAFADPVKIGPAFEMGRIYDGDGYRHDPWSRSRVHEIDYDRDGRGDLVFWNENHFRVHRQDEHGLFSTVAETFTTDVAFDSDDLATLAAPHGVRRRLMDRQPTGELTGRVLHSLTDVNGDGVADLVVFSLEGGSLWKMRSTYEVHFGRPSPGGGTVFAPEVGTAIHSDGIPFGLLQHDFDHDGRLDVMLTKIDVGVFKAIGMIVSALLTDSVPMELEFHRMADGRYRDRRTAARKIKTYPGESGEKTRYSPVLIGDVNGDGRSDLVAWKNRKELRVFVGVAGPGLFARQARKVEIAMPDEDHVWLVDLNGDGKQDLLMHLPSGDGPHRVILLIASR